MNTKLPLLLIFCLISFFLHAQESFIYATLASEEAEDFLKENTVKIKILDSNNKVAAVKLSPELLETLREKKRLHGNGYVFQATKEAALQAVKNSALLRPLQFEYTITETDFVNACLDMVNPQNIENTIVDLQDYGTRVHTRPEAIQAVMDQKEKWDAMIQAAGRTADISTRIFDHEGTPMPSVILTIEGNQYPEDYVIVGGHIDSISWDEDNAPGADDNASGIASINEMFRVLLENNYVPDRTVEMMAFAAEEIGLVGSGEIANDYANQNVNVIAFVQFDMTGYKGSSEDIYLTTDWYNDSSLNNFLENLMNTYNNSTSNHPFTYGFTACGYGCSDHASWANAGYAATLPFEAAMNEDNPNIHTPADTFSFLNTPDHAVKFTKLGLEFIIETAKRASLSTTEFNSKAFKIWVQNDELFLQSPSSSAGFNSAIIYNVAGQEVLEVSNEKVEVINIASLPVGFYIVQYTGKNGLKISKKFVRHSS